MVLTIATIKLANSNLEFSSHQQLHCWNLNSETDSQTDHDIMETYLSRF